MGLMIPIACEGPFPDVASLAALVRRYAGELQTEARVVAQVKTRSRRLVVRAVREASEWDISFSTRGDSPRMVRALASYGASLRAEYLDAHHAEGCLRLWKCVYQLDGLRVPLAGQENQSYQDHARETRYSARHPVAGFLAEHWRRLAVGRLLVRVSGAVVPRGFGAKKPATKEPLRAVPSPEEAPAPNTRASPSPEKAGNETERAPRHEQAQRGLGALLRLAEKEGRGFSLEVTLPVEAAARLASRWRAPWRWDLYDLVIEVKERSAVVYRLAGV
jgi:hypothetical protein